MRCLTRDDLRKYQNAGVHLIKSNEGCRLTPDMGLGKTIMTLTAIRDLIDEGWVGRVLIVAPLLVAETTWPDEIETWAHTRVLSYEVITGDPLRREARVQIPADIHIINKENWNWIVDYWGDDWPYDMVVQDDCGTKDPKRRSNPPKKLVEEYMTLRTDIENTGEASAALQIRVEGYLRNANIANKEGSFKPSMRTLQSWVEDPRKLPKPKGNLTRFGAACKVRHLVDRFVDLKGTPAPKGLIELWTPYYLIDKGERLGTSFEMFRKEYFDSDYMGYKYTPREGSFEKIMAKISDITLSMRSEDWLELPDRIDNMIKVKLPEKVLRKYKEFEKTFLLEEHDIEAINEGVLTGKLLQLANGSVYNADKNPVEIHSLKLDALEEIIESASGRPVLVAYSFQFDLDKIRKRFKNAVVIGDDPNAVKKWNNGEIEIMLAHPASAGHGLNLQFGGNISVWYGLPWSLELYQQFNKRLHRSGQKENVIIHHIVAEDTVDERVLAALSAKEATQDAVIEATLYRG